MGLCISKETLINGIKEEIVPIVVQEIRTYVLPKLANELNALNDQAQVAIKSSESS